MIAPPLPKPGDKVLVEFEVDRVAEEGFGGVPYLRVRKGSVAFWMPPDWLAHKPTGRTPWTCGALEQGAAGGNDPAECDWPTCGCDPYATKVIEVLEESGALKGASTVTRVIAVTCPACGKPRIWGRACGHCGAL